MGDCGPDKYGCPGKIVPSIRFHHFGPLMKIFFFSVDLCLWSGNKKLFNSSIGKALKCDKNYSRICLLQADLKGIFASVKKKDYVNYVKAIVEKSVRLMHENHANLKLSENIMMQQCVIFDMQDFSMKHITHKLGKFAIILNINITKRRRHIWKRFKILVDTQIHI